MPEFERDTNDPILPRDMIGGDNDLIDVGGGADSEFAIEFADDAPSYDTAKLFGQNEPDDEPDRRSVDDLGDETSSRLHEDIQRERQARMDAERNYLAQQEQMEKRLVESEKASLNAQKDSFKLALDGIDVRIRTAKDGLKYARSEQDYSAEVDLQSQIDELNNMRRNIEQNLNSLPDPSEIDRQFQAHTEKRRAETQQRADQSQVRALNDKAGKWIEKNSWFNDPSKAAAKKSVLDINNQLVAENYDPNSAEFFSELNRRLAKRHKDIRVADIGGTQRPPSSPPVASRRTDSPARTQSGGGSQSGKKSVTLNASDRGILKSLGIDMNNTAAVQRYAREKFERENRESRNSRQGR